MALVDIFNAVAADPLLASLLSTHFGGQGLDLEDSPPKMVWVPREITFGAKRVQGTGPSTQSMGTKAQRVEIHLWAIAADGDLSEGGPFKATELLCDRVLWAIRNTVGPATFNLLSAQWTEDSIEQLGRELVVNVSFDLPIVLQPAQDATAAVTILHVNPTTDPATSSMQETLALPTGDITRTPVI